MISLDSKDELKKLTDDHSNRKEILSAAHPIKSEKEIFELNIL